MGKLVSPPELITICSMDVASRGLVVGGAAVEAGNHVFRLPARLGHVAMGQNQVLPVNIPIPNQRF